MTLTYAEFCAGYGGLGLAVEEVFGAELKWYSEFDAAPSKVMAHHWPGVPNHGDMTSIDWSTVEAADILSGGTPCQDLSAAGRRKGMTEGTRSNLWVHMREAIAVIKPKYVVWENVRGAYSASASSDLEQCPGCVGDTSDGRVFLRALGRVLGDLSDLGYDCQWRGLRAADVGAATDDTESSSSLPTVTVQDASNTGGPSQYERNTPPLNTRVMMLPTPSANLGENGGSQHPDKRRAGNHQASIQDVAEHLLLPTPTVGMMMGGSATRSGDRSGEKLLPGVAKDLALMPTPKASDGEKGGPNQRGSKGDLTMPSVAARIGASTNPPSDVTNGPLAGQLPGQLNLLDAITDTA